MRNERILRFEIVVTSCLIDDEFTQGQCRKGSPRGARFLWNLSWGQRVKTTCLNYRDCTIWCLESREKNDYHGLGMLSGGRDLVKSI